MRSPCCLCVCVSPQQIWMVEPGFIKLVCILSRSMCDYRRGMDWRKDLLTTYTHDSELQVITAPPQISTLHKPSQHLLSVFQSAVCPTAVPWQQLLTVELLQLPALTLVLSATKLNQSASGPRYLASGWTQQETPPPTVSVLLLWAVV
jgi:hypothetical protein